MSREKLNEELFDVFLIEALRQVEEEELQKSEQFFEEHKMEDYIPSKRFVRRIKRAYRMHCIRHAWNSKGLRRAASVLLTAGIVSGSLIFLADANGFSLYETAFLRKERYTSIETYKQIVSEDYEGSLEYFYFPKYIPVDFEIVDEKEVEHYSYIRFKKDAHYFFICQWDNSEKRTTLIDTEKSMVTEIEIKGKKGFYTEKEDIKTLYLNMGNISINISGNIGKKYLFRIAENLELLAR